MKGEREREETEGEREVTKREGEMDKECKQNKTAILVP